MNKCWGGERKVLRETGGGFSERKDLGGSSCLFQTS